MTSWKLTQFLSAALIVFGGAIQALADDSFSALDLVTSDVAFCLEIPHLNDTLSTVESGPLMDRLREFPPFQKFFLGPTFAQWMKIESHVEKTTGEAISTQLRKLFANSLVLAVYVSPNGETQGILIGEAKDNESIQQATETWNGLEPKHVKTNLYHRGQKYSRRLQRPDAKEELFLASSKRWFAISDREPLIQDVIDRFIAATTDVPANEKAILDNTLRRSESFVAARARLKDNAAAYMHINARKWDRVLAETPKSPDDFIPAADAWKFVSTVASDLRFDRGVVSDTLIQLDETKLTREWKHFIATAGQNSVWNGPVPADAMLAFTTNLDVAPLLRRALRQMQPGELVELNKLLQIARSLFGGHDAVEVVLPALARSMSGIVIAKKDELQTQVSLDGLVRFSLDTGEDRGLQIDIERGLETSLSMLAAYFSSVQPEVVTVRQEENNGIKLRWLSEATPFPLVIGTKTPVIAIGRTKEALLENLEPRNATTMNSRLAADTRRFFPDANQVVWVDVSKARALIEKYGTPIANLVTTVDGSEGHPFEHVNQVLQLFDSFFLAARVESNQIRMTLGVAVDEH